MSDAEFVKEALRCFQALYKACLDFQAVADGAEEAHLQMVVPKYGLARRRFRSAEETYFQVVKSRALECSRFASARLDGLAVRRLHSPEGEWDVRLLKLLDSYYSLATSDRYVEAVRERAEQLFDLYRVLEADSGTSATGGVEGPAADASSEPEQSTHAANADATRESGIAPPATVLQAQPLVHQTVTPAPADPVGGAPQMPLPIAPATSNQPVEEREPQPDDKVPRIQGRFLATLRDKSSVIFDPSAEGNKYLGSVLNTAVAGRVSVERPELGMELAVFEAPGPRYIAFSWAGPRTARVFQGKEVTPAEAAAEFIRDGLPVPPGLPLPEGALSPVEVQEMTSGENIGAMETGTGGGGETPPLATVAPVVVTEPQADGEGETLPATGAVVVATEPRATGGETPPSATGAATTTTSQEAAENEEGEQPDGSPPLSQLLSATDLQRILKERLGRSCGGVDSFLARHRKEAVDCFEMIEGKRRTEPKILYRTADVWPILWEKYSRKQ